jgi:hypothetical protein
MDSLPLAHHRFRWDDHVYIATVLTVLVVIIVRAAFLLNHLLSACGLRVEACRRMCDFPVHHLERHEGSPISNVLLNHLVILKPIFILSFLDILESLLHYLPMMPTSIFSLL